MLFSSQLIKQLKSSIYLYYWQQFLQDHMCRICHNTPHETSIQPCTVSILSGYNSGYSTLSSVPSLVFQACRRGRLRLPDQHGHDHLAAVVTAASSRRCGCLHREQAVGGQRGADVLQVNASWQPERRERKETLSQTGVHFAQPSVFTMCAAHCHRFGGNLLVSPSEASGHQFVLILPLFMIPFQIKIIVKCNLGGQ